MRRIKIAVGVLVLLFLGLQILPMGYPRSNPPVVATPEWRGQGTEELFSRACADCHSNETNWPWYSGVAPVSWILPSHVRHGRGTLNVSEWDPEADAEVAAESARTIRDGSMPPADYLRMHPEARLSPDEIRMLIRGLELTFPGEPRE